MPDDVIRRRFRAGLRNLFSVYLDSVDSWTIYANADAVSPRLIASRGVDGPDVIADKAAWKALKEFHS